MTTGQRLLISAYACAPGLGSEAEGGWNWVRHSLDAGHDVTVLTHPDSAVPLTAALGGRGRVVGVGPTRWAGAFAGHPRVYADYLAWQDAGADIAHRLHGERPFDLVHHVSWGSLIWGSPLWRVPAPFAFGPIGGGQTSPEAFRAYFGDDWPKEALRTFLVRHAIARNPRARATVRNARLVAVTNAATGDAVRRMGATSVLELLDSGLAPEDEAEPSPPPDRPPGSIHLIWVGRLMARKALPLALEAVAAAARTVDVRLTVVGDGPQGPSVPTWIRTLGLEDRVRWLGQVEHARVRSLVAAADALLFTSVQDSFGSQVLEAAAQGRPVIALDLHGVATHLPSAAGCKVPATTRTQTIADLAAAIADLAGDPARRAAAGAAARRFALSQRWPERVRRLHAAAGLPVAAT